MSPHTETPHQQNKRKSFFKDDEEEKKHKKKKKKKDKALKDIMDTQHNIDSSA